MTLPPALARALRLLLLRQSGAIAIVLKLALVFGVGAATAEGIALLRAYFEVHPDAQDAVTDVILEVVKWSVGAAIVLYGLAWGGRKAGLPVRAWRRLDLAGNIILGTLAGTLIAIMVLLFFTIAYIFIRQLATVLYNVLA